MHKDNESFNQINESRPKDTEVYLNMVKGLKFVTAIDNEGKTFMYNGKGEWQYIGFQRQ